ncbi:hypothetical protein PVA45_07735 (plasmid) [Entomospira entomophila]|uniref:Uncharacterized protein n=1 Tax=Entomospira entomophila TaxID=2719988 RepID=A0A968GE66_9SPIO|nr:hypothetical protein [Entomospira entomophilus]NIZ41394.1 hypothetical protein [Entomospira entomophilus]WDI36344.1 hypothetical protein PVA45_07735 [Entomospira entomophilus]
MSDDPFLPFFIFFFLPVLALQAVFFTIAIIHYHWKKMSLMTPSDTQLALKVARLGRIRNLLMVIVIIAVIILMWQSYHWYQSLDTWEV